jgi:hypothetical protein
MTGMAGTIMQTRGNEFDLSQVPPVFNNRRSGGSSLEYLSYWALTETFSGNGALCRDEEQLAAPGDCRRRQRPSIDH